MTRKPLPFSTRDVDSATRCLEKLSLVSVAFGKEEPKFKGYGGSDTLLRSGERDVSESSSPKTGKIIVKNGQYLPNISKF